VLKIKEKAVRANAYCLSLSGEFLPSPQGQRKSSYFSCRNLCFLAHRSPANVLAPLAQGWGTPITEQAHAASRTHRHTFVIFLVPPITDTGTGSD